MLFRTHLAFGIFGVLMFVGSVNYKLAFVAFALAGTIIPDLDSPSSSWGRHLIFRPLQFFARHRGIMHSFFMAIVISFFLALVLPVACFGFFVGYSFHLVLDSFTKEGICFFWPFKHRCHGFVRTGERLDELLFVFLAGFDLLIAVFLVVGFFA